MLICIILLSEISSHAKGAKKPQALLHSLASRKAGDVIQSELKGLRVRGANGVNPSLRTGRI